MPYWNNSSFPIILNGCSISSAAPRLAYSKSAKKTGRTARNSLELRIAGSMKKITYI